MKYVLTENQIPKELVKKMFFKYWERFEPKLSDQLFSLIGQKTYNSNYFNQARGWLIEFLGGEEAAAELADEILDTIPYHVNNCGSYDFKFTIDSIDSNGDHWTIYCYADPEGKFTHIETGREYTLKELDDESPAWVWEVSDEMAECISELIEEKEFVARTGIDFTVVMSGLWKEKK